MATKNFSQYNTPIRYRLYGGNREFPLVATDPQCIYLEQKKIKVTIIPL